jgi:hypothetical protein
MSRNNRNDDHDFGDEAFRDDDLRARFAELRREETALAPDFVVPSRSWVEPVGRWSAGRLAAVTACLAAMVTGAVWLGMAPPKPGGNGQPVASLMEWKAPTDFLLQTPGRELLRTVPAIGVWHDYTGAPGERGKFPRVRKLILFEKPLVLPKEEHS